GGIGNGVHRPRLRGLASRSPAFAGSVDGVILPRDSPGERRVTTLAMQDAEHAFLGVERSYCGRRWRQRRADDRQGLAIAQRFGIPELVGRLLAARDVTVDSAAAFLNPTLRELLPDPSLFRDMDRAVERLQQAITRQEKIAVFGDY